MLDGCEKVKGLFNFGKKGDLPKQSDKEHLTVPSQSGNGNYREA